MRSRNRPEDWERLFAPDARRRGGPLRVFFNSIIGLLVLGVIAGLVFGGVRLVERQRQLAEAQATAQTIMAEAATATRVAEDQAAAATRVAATAIAAQTPTAEPILGNTQIARGGNLRTEPRIANDTVVGLVWPGDQVVLFEEREVDGQRWYRLRVEQVAEPRGGNGVAAGTQGWVSALLLTPP